MATSHYYFIVYEDGTTGYAYAESAPPLSKPGEYVTYAEYSVAYTTLRETSYASTLAGMNATVEQKRKNRDAYISLGIDPLTAADMSGYNTAVSTRDQFVAGHDDYVAVMPSLADIEAGRSWAPSEAVIEW